MLTVILAGGGSRRMGQDKANLSYAGMTMLQYQINKYRALGDVAVSVNAGGKYRFSGAAELIDRFPDMGPLNGLVSGFRETDAEEIFLTAVDLPYGEPELVLRLQSLRGDADVCILRRGKKGMEPLFALYSRSCGAAAERSLRSGRKAVFDIFDSVSVRYVDPTELPEFDLDRVLTNVNTPEDYESLCLK